MKIIRVAKIRIKDKHTSELNRQARAVNFVWNYCNDVQQRAVKAGRKWFSNFSLQLLTSGSSAELDIHAHTIQRVCSTYDQSRKNTGKPWLRWRSRRSLGWVPFNTGHVKFDGSAFVFRGKRYTPMHVPDFLKADAKALAGSFNQDSLGRWFLNVPVELDASEQKQQNPVGIDLGLKDMATLSDGVKIEIQQFYRKSEAFLANAQRRRKSRRVKAIHRKIASRRKDFLHKASTAIAKKYGLIFVGNVSASKLAKTKMAKSVLDAGWSTFKNMLSYKAIMHGGKVIVVNEAYTSQTCSSCGSLPTSRPRGIAGLSKRVWRCDDCETVQDRDVNAARNILRIGLDTLSEGAA